MCLATLVFFLPFDQEPSIIVAQSSRQELTGCDVLAENSPHARNQVAKLRESYKQFMDSPEGLKHKSGSRTADSPMLTWLREHTATLLALHKGQGGFTPFHRLRDRPWSVSLPFFGRDCRADEQTSVGVGCTLDSRNVPWSETINGEDHRHERKSDSGSINEKECGGGHLQHFARRHESGLLWKTTPRRGRRSKLGRSDNYRTGNA